MYIFFSRICLGPMVDIWPYIIKNVKHESFIKIMRGNLQLHSGSQGPEVSPLTIIYYL